MFPKQENWFVFPMAFSHRVLRLRNGNGNGTAHRILYKLLDFVRLVVPNCHSEHTKTIEDNISLKQVKHRNALCSKLYLNNGSLPQPTTHNATARHNSQI